MQTGHSWHRTWSLYRKSIMSIILQLHFIIYQNEQWKENALQEADVEGGLHERKNNDRRGVETLYVCVCMGAFVHACV